MVQFYEIYNHVMVLLEKAKESNGIDKRMNYYCNSGDVIKDSGIAVAILNRGILPISEIRAVDMYVYNVSIEIFCRELFQFQDYRELEDSQTLLNFFALEYKAKVDEIGGVNVIYSIPNNFRKFDLGNNEYKLTLDFTITTIGNGIISDSFKFYLTYDYDDYSRNKEEIYYTNFNQGRISEHTFDNFPTSEIKSFKNTTNYQLHLTGVAIRDSAVYDIILNELIRNSVDINQTYLLVIELDGVELKTYDVYVDSITVTGKSNSMLAYSMTLLPKSTI